MQLISYMSPGFPVALFVRIGEILGADVEFETELSGPAPGEDPFVSSTDSAAESAVADLGWICSTSFVDLGTRGDDPSVQLVGVAWVPDDPGAEGRPVYFGDVVVRAGSGLRRFDDLAGARIACNDPVSLSGHYSLKFALADRGLPDDFLNIEFTGGHHNSLDLLIAGEVDAALVDSVVRTARQRHDAEVRALEVIERLGPWPTQPLVARASLDAEQVAEVRRLLLDASADPALRKLLDESAIARLTPVEADHYSAVRIAMARLDEL